MREVLSRYPGVPLIIELKVNDPGAGAAHDRRGPRRRSASIASRWDRSDGACCRAARQYEPRIPTGASREEVRLALYRSWIRWPLGATQRTGSSRCPSGRARRAIVSRGFVAHAHRAGLPVKVWTVNDPADMRRLLDWGVDALISDRPDLAVAAVRTHSGVSQ